jgi:hypothetical protein
MRTGKHRSAGKVTVKYRNVDGMTQNATVLAMATNGTTNNLKLLIGSGPYRRIVDNVPLATARNQTGVYFNYRP